MSYRALFVADVHAGNQLPWAVKDPATMITDRLVDIIDVLTQMSSYAQERGLTDIWILGDLIDKRLVDAVTLDQVTAKLIEMQRSGLIVRLLPGNHEAGDAAGRSYTLNAFHHLGFWVAGVTDRVRGEQLSLIEPVPGFEVVATPYLPAGRALELLERSTFHNPALLLIHQTIKGGMVGGWTAPDGLEPALLEGVAAWVLSGHFHTPQSITERTHYLGAPVQHNFGDEGDDRGFWDVVWTGKKCIRTKVPILGAPRFQTLRWITSGPELADLPSLDGIAAKSYVNLQVVGTESTVNKQWITAERWCVDAEERGARSARSTRGVIAETGRARIQLNNGDQRPTWDAVLSQYLDAADCTGLDRQKLEALGKELMADADR